MGNGNTPRGHGPSAAVVTFTDQGNFAPIGGRKTCSQTGSERWPSGPNAFEEQIMAKSERKGNKELRKPKKAGPPNQNASNPSMTGLQPPQKS